MANHVFTEYGDERETRDRATAVVKAINQPRLGHIVCIGPGKGRRVDRHDHSTVAGQLPPKDHS